MMEYDEKAARATERSYLEPEIVRQRIRTLDALALRAGERVLDVGCGPGLLAHDMALQVGVAGRVVGVDKSEAMLKLAQQRCAHLSQVEFKQGMAENLCAEDQSFHALACTQVLLYVPDVKQALSEMRRVLKPGGRIAVIETDWRSTVLTSNEQALTRKITAGWDDAVPSPNLPVQLGPLLREFDFTAIRVEAIPVLNTSYSADSFSAAMAKTVAAAAQERGLVSEAEARTWLDDLKRLEQARAYFFCVNRFLFSAVRA
jgi:SAM-dependent methyltransferase